MSVPRRNGEKGMKRTATGTAEGALWWAGWRPLAVASLGALVGVLAGYAAGVLGPATAVVGVVVVSVGFFAPWLRRMGFVGALVAFVVFYVVGPSTAERGLEQSGVGTEWTGLVADTVLNIRALVGSPSGEATAVVGGGVASLSLWSLAGAAGGGAVWLVGAYVVNSGYGDLYSRFVGEVEREGAELLGDDDLHTFTHGEETAPVVRSAKRYRATNLLVGDSSLSLHHGSTVDMVTRDGSVSDSTKELYYDQVASVDYEEPFLKVRMSDGEVVKIVTSGKPVEVIEEVEDRLQTYKASPPSGADGPDRSVEGVNETEDEEETVGGDTDGEPEELGEEIVDEVDEALESFGEEFDGDETLGAFGEAFEGDETEERD